MVPTTSCPLPFEHTWNRAMGEGEGFSARGSSLRVLQKKGPPRRYVYLLNSIAFLRSPPLSYQNISHCFIDTKLLLFLLPPARYFFVIVVCGAGVLFNWILYKCTTNAVKRRRSFMFIARYLIFLIWFFFVLEYSFKNIFFFLLFLAERRTVCTMNYSSSHCHRSGKPAADQSLLDARCRIRMIEMPRNAAIVLLRTDGQPPRLSARGKLKTELNWTEKLTMWVDRSRRRRWWWS